MAAYSIAENTFAIVRNPNIIHAKAMMVKRMLPCLPGPAYARLGHLLVAIAPPTSHMIQRMRLRAVSPWRKPSRLFEVDSERNKPRWKMKVTGTQMIVRIEVTSNSTTIGSGGGV